ncbi:BASS sodium/metabolite symporter [Chloropicon primus]|uniref:BASS sodium/metabolite symporter n=1 Tax=Chloropicon primus TaxID=1764295 RepID=A0A5B8MWQ0_9CHLO|nr:BASS sodium/metabolite symporter [Chloropicon primus]|eukprot:QDZ24731.1 BASS sodium/metabolite symporter [Chloropicon primus]
MLSRRQVVQRSRCRAEVVQRRVPAMERSTSVAGEVLSVPRGVAVFGHRARAWAPRAASNDASESGSPSVLTLATNLFPVWVLLACMLAVWRPLWFSWFKGDPFMFGLSSTMLGMGLTLTLEDVKRALMRLTDVSRGCLLQYTVMPVLGYLVSRIFQLPKAFAVGVVLVACCPGGTSSNIVSYLARADVPLSVMMTTLSTAGAVFMTPLLTKLFAGALVPVNAGAMLWSTAQIVLLPVLVGALANTSFPKTTAKVARCTPVYAVLMVALLCASVVARNASTIISAGPVLFMALVALHSGGFLLGYAMTKLTGGQEKVARTTSIEVGMQNSALGCVLATLHFSDPMTAAPAAISACIHSVIGSTIAGLWRATDHAREARHTRE